MSPRPPEQVGAYTIDKEIGRGGMGVVYLGHDTRLDRAVAIKVMPEHLAADADRLNRFEREARTLASLTHPNVAGIYGVEEQDGQKYLVLEYVEGQTLAEQLDRGPFPMAEALDVAIQIAAGMEAAHEAGIVHRDLKPANVIVTPEGQVKVLDFGLAHIEEGSSSNSGLTADPTLDSPAQQSPTMPGVILGTAAYMSPEQARGRRIDKRSDIWSFGVVLYEMLAGVGPFVGETVSDSIGAILHKEVDLNRLPATVPPMVRHVLDRCLQRDKNKRYRDIGDVRLELESLEAGVLPSAVPQPTGRLLRLGALVLALIAAAGWSTVLLRGDAQDTPAPSLQLTIPLPEGLEANGAIALSRDGRTLAFEVQDEDGESRIAIRDLDAFDLRTVAGSRGGGGPFFSPDGQSICFVARESILKASVSGGNPTELAKAASLVGGSWGDDGLIVYSTGVNSPLWAIPETGGTAKPLTVLADDPQAYAHVWPQHIPGTRKLLFTSWVGGGRTGGPRILDLDSGKVSQLTESGAIERDSFMPPARWAASGHLIFESWSNGLLVMPFDPEAEKPVSLAGAHQLLENVYHLGNSTHSVFSLSDHGTLAYMPGNPGSRRLVWVDPNGTVEPIIDQDEVDEYGLLGGGVRLSPDGKRALEGGGGQIIEIDLERRLARPLTSGDGTNNGPMWSPDGSRVIYASNKEVRWSIWSVGLAAGSVPELVLQRDRASYPQAVAPDGSVLFLEIGDEGGNDLWILDPGGDVRPLANTESHEYDGVFSPDGKWVAYASDATGRDEVYIVPASGSGTPVQISIGGGNGPMWGPEGKSLCFRRWRKVLQVGVEAGRPVGDPQEVFTAPNLLTGNSYDITADGSRLIAVQKNDEAIADEIRIVTNFFDTIRQVANPSSP